MSYVLVVSENAVATSTGTSRLADANLGVWGPNKAAPIHRWVSFTEGFSARLVAEELRGLRTGAFVFDPFGGTGTTPLVAAEFGFSCGFSEVNPFLREAAETKLAALGSPKIERGHATAELLGALLQGPKHELSTENPLVRANSVRQFIDGHVLEELVGWLQRFSTLDCELARRLGRLAVATATVPVSNMKRAVDLRRRTPAELARRRPEVRDVIRSRITDITADLEAVQPRHVDAKVVSTDARELTEDIPAVDVVVTSPPYLNGTNYFRNTKLELLLLGHLQNESELKLHRSRAITAGINNVSRRISVPRRFEAVEEVASLLDDVAYDPRIPTMVRAYFSDMSIVLEALRLRMNAHGRLVLDIGDSRFAGVHVDTPELLETIATQVGWQRGDTRVLRARVAKDGNPLCQKLLYLSLS